MVPSFQAARSAGPSMGASQPLYGAARRSPMAFEPGFRLIRVLQDRADRRPLPRLS